MEGKPSKRFASSVQTSCLQSCVTVPHPKKDLGTGLVKAIRKQAHLEE